MNNDQLVQQPKRQPFSSKVLYGVSILAILVAAALVVFATVGFVRDNQQQTAIDDQARQTKELVEQVKKQAEDNQKTSQQAANYAYCNAVLLSQYTKTLQPISIDDLNTCVLSSFPNSSVSTQGSQPQASSGSSSSNSSSSSSNQGSQTMNPAPTSPATPSTPAPSPTPTPAPQNQNSPTVGTTPTGLLPGINVTLPCVNALGLLQLGCRQ